MIAFLNFFIKQCHSEEILFSADATFKQQPFPVLKKIPAE
jgi:hypothetical protein